MWHFLKSNLIVFFIRSLIPKKSLLDYMEYLAERAAKKAWDQMEEVDEPLSDEEKKELAEAKTDDEFVSLEDLKRELKL